MTISDAATKAVVADLLALVQTYNESAYVDALFYAHGVETDCPRTIDGVLTPCDLGTPQYAS